MKTETPPPPVTPFPRAVVLAIAHLKERLQYDYDQAYPGLDEIIRLVIAQEEARAWDLSSFPHLILPDLVETQLAQLGLPSAETRHETTLTPLSRAELVLAEAC